MDARKVVSELVRVDSVVVREFKAERVLSASGEGHHRLGPPARVWSVARRLAADVELLVALHDQTQHARVEVDGGLEVSHLEHEVQRPARQNARLLAPLPQCQTSGDGRSARCSECSPSSCGRAQADGTESRHNGSRTGRACRLRRHTDGGHGELRGRAGGGVSGGGVGSALVCVHRMTMRVDE